MDDIRVLQLGTEDWSKCYRLPEQIEWHYAAILEEAPEKPYDIVFLDRNPETEERTYLVDAVKAYTLFVTERVQEDSFIRQLYEEKKGQQLSTDRIQEFLLQELPCFFPKPYGEKFRLENLAIAQGFSGSVMWNGNCDVTLSGDFGEELHQIAFWRNNIPVFKGQTIDLWLEYKKTAGVEIALSVTQFVGGSIAKVLQKWDFNETDLEQVVQLENKLADGPVFMSLLAKGKGTLQIIALHDRYSRKSHGYFLPGGERYVTSEREELFCYFDPGDRKPPLNVYFSGYKTQEGFEGYNMMKRLGAPFLLISEARLEGGSFYMGSKEYEQMILDAIHRYMEQLGFGADQVILSGLSMGTYGALYYSCELSPHAMILGKPLASIGTVAENERLLRPGGFPTSLDVLMKLYEDTDENAIHALNERFWNRFDKADWHQSKFIISYMIEDDYDTNAYQTLLSHLQSEGVQVYGKGIHGRHNDNTYAIVNWFVNQYEKVLKEDFFRRIEK